MDISDLLKQGNMGNISPEKLNFLMQFANQNHSGNAKEMASELSQAASTAKKEGIEFSENERDMMINILKQNMSEEERKREWEQKWERNRKEKNSREKNRKGTRGISRNNFL